MSENILQNRREVLIQIYSHSRAESVNHFDIQAVDAQHAFLVGVILTEKGKVVSWGQKFLAITLVCDLLRPAMLNKSLFFYI